MPRRVPLAVLALLVLLLLYLSLFSVSFSVFQGTRSIMEVDSGVQGRCIVYPVGYESEQKFKSFIFKPITWIAQRLFDVDIIEKWDEDSDIGPTVLEYVWKEFF